MKSVAFYERRARVVKRGSDVPANSESCTAVAGTLRVPSAEVALDATAHGVCLLHSLACQVFRYFMLTFTVLFSV